MVLHFLNAIIITFVSWTIGLLLNNAIKTAKFYSKISNLNFIKNDGLSKILGLNSFGWIIKNSFFKVFNQNIKLKQRASREDLKQLRNEMVYAEIGHIIGFTFIIIIILIKLWSAQYMSALIMLVFNVIFNLYPALLQQHNKKRIDTILKQ